MDLKNKAISIKGKKYVLVSDRVLEFNKVFKNGCIQTVMITKADSETIIVKAKVVPDVANSERYFTGYSQAKIGDGFINKTSALENAETSAVGRALALMGIGVLDSIASVDEINKANARNYYIDKYKREKQLKANTERLDELARNEKSGNDLPF